MRTQLTIRLPDDLDKALKLATRRMQRRSSDIVRLALREFLGGSRQRTGPPIERVRGLIGSLESGIPDLAARHREQVLKSLTRRGPRVAGDLLLDTGALVSLLDRSQRDHGACARFFESWDGPVLSSEAVLAEATHLLGGIPGGRRACLDFFLAGAAALVPATLASLRRARELIEQYASLPMDYADATLVVLAEEIGTDLVFTTDRRDFGAYRIRGRRRFRIVPD